MNPWFILGAIVVFVAYSAGMVHVGQRLEREAWEGKELTKAEKVIVRQQVLIKEVPKIVVKVETREVEVTKEVDRVLVISHHMLADDCVMPEHYGVLLVAAARGLDPEAPGVADSLAGAYGCRETLDATLKDLRAGWRNSARLLGLQQWAQVVTKGE